MFEHPLIRLASFRLAATAARLAAMAAFAGLMLAQGPPNRPAPRPRTNAFAPGADDKHVTDNAASDRGRKTYAAECITCHGSTGRGGDRGADLVRSLVVLSDRYSDHIGPFLRKGHQNTASAKFTDDQIQDLSHTLHKFIDNTMRGALEIQDVLTGDPAAGKAYFNGDGKCSTCHSATGDFKGIGRRMDPPTLQQRFLFPRIQGFGRRLGAAPRVAKPVTVEVTPEGGKAVSGELVHIDEFNVSLRNASGEYVAFARTPRTKVVKNDPLQFHIDQLPKYTDKNMHDIVAYLESLK